MPTEINRYYSFLDTSQKLKPKESMDLYGNEAFKFARAMRYILYHYPHKDNPRGSASYIRAVNRINTHNSKNPSQIIYDHRSLASSVELLRQKLITEQIEIDFNHHRDKIQIQEIPGFEYNVYDDSTSLPSEAHLTLSFSLTALKDSPTPTLETLYNVVSAAHIATAVELGLDGKNIDGSRIKLSDKVQISQLPIVAAREAQQQLRSDDRYSLEAFRTFQQCLDHGK